jgi:hypothetical protein
MREEIEGSQIITEITGRARLLRAFPRLRLRDQWAYYNLAVWERVFGVQW